MFDEFLGEFLVGLEYEIDLAVLSDVDPLHVVDAGFLHPADDFGVNVVLCLELVGAQNVFVHWLEYGLGHVLGGVEAFLLFAVELQGVEGLGIQVEGLPAVLESVVSEVVPHGEDCPRLDCFLVVEVLDFAP